MEVGQEALAEKLKAVAEEFNLCALRAVPAALDGRTVEICSRAPEEQSDDKWIVTYVERAVPKNTFAFGFVSGVSTGRSEPAGTEIDPVPATAEYVHAPDLNPGDLVATPEEGGDELVWRELLFRPGRLVPGPRTVVLEFVDGYVMDVAADQRMLRKIGEGKDVK